MLRPAMLVLLCAACAVAQDHVAPPQGQPEPKQEPQAADGIVTVDAAFERMREAYRMDPIAERLVVTFTSDEGKRAESHLVLRCDATGASPRVALELGPLAVSVSGGRLVAIHEAQRTTCFTADVPDPVTIEAIERVLPPIPVPQLALVLDPAGVPSTPYTPDIRWTDAALEAGGPDAKAVVIEGHAAFGPARLVLDAQTGRIKHFEAVVSGAGARLAIDTVPLDPGDPAQWNIHPGNRLPVSRLDQLTTRPRVLRPGDPAPDITALSLELESWSLQDTVGALGAEISSSYAGAEQQVARKRSAARILTLILFRLRTTEPGESEHIAAILNEMRERVANRRPAPRVCGVAIVDLTKVDLGVVRAASERWAGGAGHVPWIDPVLRWTSNDEAIKAFDPDEDVVVLFLDENGNIAGLVMLRGNTPGEVVRRLEELLADPAATKSTTPAATSAPAPGAHSPPAHSSGPPAPLDPP